MTSRENVLAAWEGRPSEHVPLATWCFGFTAPQHLRWERDGKSVDHWYSLRMEHLHTLPEQWTLEDDFKRVLAWQSMGLDDVLDVSVPWSMDAAVTWKDSLIPAGQLDACPVMAREYSTPAGMLRHAVRQTGEYPGAGWVIQPEHVPLIEDYNIPRAIEHAVSSPSDIPKMRYLFKGPDSTARQWFLNRMEKVKAFADLHGVPVQAWSAFGMDAVVWFTGTEAAIMLAMDEPEAFGSLLDIVTEADLARTELAASTPGVDMVVERGWYSSTDFWSPRIFEEYMYPHIRQLADMAHKYHKKFGYVMTTGVEVLGNRLANAGVDVLYFVDPIQDRVSLDRAREKLGDSMTLVGGINALTLAAGNDEGIRKEVFEAMDALVSSNRFILQPVDCLFPEVPWKSVESLVGAWSAHK